MWKSEKPTEQNRTGCNNWAADSGSELEKAVMHYSFRGRAVVRQESGMERSLAMFQAN